MMKIYNLIFHKYYQNCLLVEKKTYNYICCNRTAYTVVANSYADLLSMLRSEVYDLRLNYLPYYLTLILSSKA